MSASTHREQAYTLPEELRGPVFVYAMPQVLTVVTNVVQMRRHQRMPYVHLVCGCVLRLSYWTPIIALKLVPCCHSRFVAQAFSGPMN